MKRTLCAIAISVLTACNAPHTNQAAATGPAQKGKPAPGFSLPLSTGGKLALSSLHGRPVYLNFFATWCPPCNEEAPDVNALQKKYAAHGLSVVAVDELENAKAAESFRKKFSLVYPAVVDSGALQEQYAVNGLPVHVFIDRNGVIYSIVEGEMSKSQIEEKIKAIL